MQHYFEPCFGSNGTRSIGIRNRFSG